MWRNFLTKVFVNFSFRQSRKNKKTYDERNGRSSSFIINKARISVQLQLQLNSLRKGVVCLEVWIWQVMVWAIITWETSSMVPLSYAPQDHIFHIHVWLDIWRCRPTRINVRLNKSYRKAMNSNGNQVCRVFSWTQWECICSSVMNLTDLISKDMSKRRVSIFGFSLSKTRWNPCVFERKEKKCLEVCLARHRTTSLTYMSDETCEGAQLQGYMWECMRRQETQRVCTTTNLLRRSS